MDTLQGKPTCLVNLRATDGVAAPIAFIVTPGRHAEYRALSCRNIIAS
jgi:hypothetical protein